MRDKRKDSGYFEVFLKHQNSRIDKYSNKLAETNDQDKQQRILTSLVKYYVDVIKADFSAGADKKKLSALLTKACRTAAEYKKNVSETLLVLISFAIMLNQKEAVKELIKNNESMISANRLLSYFAGAVTRNDGKWDCSIKLPPEYAWLDPVFETEDPGIQTEKLQNYLNYYWYPNHAEYAWYDSDSKDTNTYCGYWSFESAALVETLGLNEQDFEGMEYYPAI